MSWNHSNENAVVRMELKYCEHCGGLWMREPGSGIVYCERCQPKVADLPIPKKRGPRTSIGGGESPAVEEFQLLEELMDLEAAGGVA